MFTLPLSKLIDDQRLVLLADKVDRSQRLSFEDGLLLYETPDLTGLGVLADRARTKLHGKKTYFVQSRRMSYTNICCTRCQFCAFHASPGDQRGYVINAEDVIAELKKPQNQRICELHMVGGHHPKLKIDYFENLFRAIKGHFPYIHLKVFTMVEIDFYARSSKISVEEFLARCIAAGLESCPGGGAEIFDPDIRRQICAGKKDAEVWLDAARACHKKGIPTNCTMLYGHLENACHKVDHLLRLRQLQDESLALGHPGFLAYVPLAYQTEDNELNRAHKIPKTTGAQDLREIAVARLLLDNIPHIKAYWVMITPGLAQIALSYGADDLDGTVIEEEIAHLAGAKTPQGLTIEYLHRLVTEAGFEAIERDHLYRDRC
ncbi:MAG: aminofutalosine synthase MqnE [Holophagales bacterium]|jgi:aminodeoxyfutalosine synthase|nr:aminofutalosine synthase MqnE [Holophagales bacterium]